ncbi:MULTISPECIES: hypothetical protein [Moorena]|nr:MULTISPECIES: hypothetical protein [Moorena]
MGSLRDASTLLLDVSGQPSGVRGQGSAVSGQPSAYFIQKYFK